MSIEGVLASPDQRSPVYLVEFQQGPNFYRYTTASDEDKIIGGQLFLRATVAIEKITQSVSEGPGGEGTITLASDDPVVQIFDAFLPVEPVTCSVSYYEENDVTRTIRNVLSGEVTGPTDDDAGMSKLRVRPFYQSFNRAIPWQVQQETCVLTLYGVQCGVNAEDYRIGAHGVALITPGYVEAAAWDTTDPTYFKAGYVTNKRTREVRFILDQQGGKLIISYPFDQATVTDNFDAFAGCQRTGKVCQEKFDNKINFMGFEKIPTKNLFKAGIK